jgi:hypothetical protein
MQVINMCGRAILKIIVGILSIALVLVIWYKAAPLVVTLLDFNLAMIKTGCHFLPTPYGAMAESALRGALAADKAMLFAEGTLAVKGFLSTLNWIFQGNKKSGMKLLPSWR